MSPSLLGPGPARPGSAAEKAAAGKIACPACPTKQQSRKQSAGYSLCKRRLQPAGRRLQPAVTGESPVPPRLVATCDEITM